MKTAPRTTRNNGRTVVRYHDTDVVSFSAKEITLNSDGWKTATTKRRMNQASAEFNLNYHVYQSAGEWFVEIAGVHIEFSDGMTIPRTPTDA